jgi:hypothetical protein
MGQVKMHTKFSPENLTERDRLGERGMDSNVKTKAMEAMYKDITRQVKPTSCLGGVS